MFRQHIFWTKFRSENRNTNFTSLKCKTCLPMVLYWSDILPFLAVSVIKSVGTILARVVYHIPGINQEEKLTKIGPVLKKALRCWRWNECVKHRDLVPEILMKKYIGGISIPKANNRRSICDNALVNICHTRSQVIRVELYWQGAYVCDWAIVLSIVLAKAQRKNTNTISKNTRL